jgi:predicted nucleic acid-binding Zn ribbon protein
LWTSLKAIIPKKIKSLGLGEAMEFAGLIKKWDEIIKEVADKEFVKKSQPVELKKSILIVDCLNSIWANELRFKEEKILEKIKVKTKVKVEKIKFIT